MGFTTFLDNLGLIEILLAIVASLFAYAGVLVWWNIRANDPKGLRSVLQGLAAPAAGVGTLTLALALWGEMTWPFLASDGMAGYNIFFFDPLALMAIVLLAFAVSVRYSTKLQYVGVLALVAGAATIFYGYTGWTANPAFTKDPFDTFLLYSGFGAAGVFAFPVSVVVDYYLKVAEAGKVAFAFLGSSSRPASIRKGIRAAQPVLPGVTPTAVAASESDATEAVSYRFPWYLQTLVLLFPVIIGLAAVAAFWYFGTTIPGHLGTGPSGAP